MVESEMVPQNTSRGGPSLDFLRNPSGILLIVNFVGFIFVFVIQSTAPPFYICFAVCKKVHRRKKWLNFIYIFWIGQSVFANCKETYFE